MRVASGTIFVDVLALHNESNRFAGSASCHRALPGFLVRLEGMAVVAAIRFIRGTALRTTPNAALKHFVPDLATAGFCAGWVCPDKGWIEGATK